MSVSSSDRSSFDFVSSRLQTYGEYSAMRLEMSDDVELLVERLENVRKLGAEYAKIELSPYMEVLLGATRKSTKKESKVSAMVAVGS